MSFALVYWLKSCTTSIIDTHSIPTSSVGFLSVNDIVCAPFGLDYHTAKILKMSDDVNLLEEIEVSGDGEIMERFIDVGESANRMMSKKTGMVKSDEACDYSDKENWDGSFESANVMNHSSSTDIGIEIESKRSSQNKKDLSKKRMQDEGRLLALKRQKLKKESIKKLEMNLLENDRGSHESFPNSIESSQSVHCPIRDKKKKVFKVETANGSMKVEELHRGSGVHVDYEKLKSMKAKLAQNPNEMIRQLLRMLIGVDELKTMTALGTTKTKMPIRKGIPSHILLAVKEFVDRKCTPVRTKMEYHKVINKYCDSLRNPRRLKIEDVVARDDPNTESR